MLNVAERTLYLLLNLCSYVELCNIAVEDRGLGNWTTFSWIIVFLIKERNWETAE